MAPSVKRWNRVAALAALLVACGSRPPALTEQPVAKPTRILIPSQTQVLEYDLASGAFKRVFASGFAFATAAALGPDGHVYVGDFTAKTVVRLNAQSGVNMGVLATVGCGVEALTFGPANDLFVGCDGPILRFNGTTGAALGTFVPAPGTGYTAGGMTFDGGSLYVTWLSSGPGTLIRYDAASGATLGTVYAAFAANGPRKPVFGPDGALYVPDWQTPTVKKFAPSTLAYAGNIVNDTGAVPMSVAFTPDGDLLVLSDPCCPTPPQAPATTVRRYDRATGNFLGTMIAAGSGGLYRAQCLLLAP